MGKVEIPKWILFIIILLSICSGMAYDAWFSQTLELLRVLGTVVMPNVTDFVNALYKWVPSLDVLPGWVRMAVGAWVCLLFVLVSTAFALKVMPKRQREGYERNGNV